MARPVSWPSVVLLILALMACFVAFVFAVGYAILPSQIEHSLVIDCIVMEAKVTGADRRKSDEELARDIWTCTKSNAYFSPSDIKVRRSATRISVALEYDRPITLFGQTLFVRHFKVDESRPIY